MQYLQGNLQNQSAFQFSKRFCGWPRRMAWLIAALLLVVWVAPALGATDDAPTAGNTKVLVVGVNAQPPFSMHSAKGQWQGMSINLWKHVAKELGYQFKFKSLAFQDLLKGAQDGSLDAVISPTTITSGREQAMDFTQPYFVTGFGIAVPDSGGSWFDAITPFFSLSFLKAVISLAIILVIAGVLVWLVERKHNQEEFAEGPGHGILASVWWAAVTMTTVGYGDKSPTTAIGRLMGIVWMFAGVILISGFTAAITTSLTVHRMQGPVQGVLDLANARIGTVAGMNSAAYLKDNHYIFKTYDSLDDSLNALKKGQIEAVVYDKPFLKYNVRKNFHGVLRVLPAVFDRQYYGIALPTGSKMREPLNQAILQYIKSDQWQAVLQQYLGEYQ